MPLPDSPFKLEGGCNCGAIRYRVTVPSREERPVYPGHGQAVNPPVRMPFSCTDHCNDCRAATGALLPTWLLTPMEMVETSLVCTSDLPTTGRIDPRTSKRGPWQPAAAVFCAPTYPEDSTLHFFASSERRRRSFCNRCGTQFAYQVYPKLEFLPFDMLDIVLGTVDREYLESVDLKPERQLHWERGMEWVQDFTTAGLGEKAPKHKDWSVASQV